MPLVDYNVFHNIVIEYKMRGASTANFVYFLNVMRGDLSGKTLSSNEVYELYTRQI